MIDSDEPGPIRVLLAGDETARSLVRAMQGTTPEIVVIAEASSLDHTLGLAARLKPDVIVAACGTFKRDRATSIAQLASVARTSRILVVSARADDEEWLLVALDVGASGVVSSDATRDELFSAIHAVANDQVVVRRTAVAALTARGRHLQIGEQQRSEPYLTLARLTDREQSVLRLTAEGYSAREVGAKLSISKKTVETYKKRIGEKLGFYHRAEYVRFALQVGVLSSAPRYRTREPTDAAGDAA